MGRSRQSGSSQRDSCRSAWLVAEFHDLDTVGKVEVCSCAQRRQRAEHAVMAAATAYSALMCPA